MDDKSKIELYDKLKEERECSDGKYTFRIEFTPVKLIVFGMVGIILVTALGALLSKVFIM